MRLKNYLLALSTHALPDIESVQHALQNLDAALLEDGRPELRNFNHAYLIITRNVLSKAKEGYFSDITFLEKFDTCFAGYYFRALKSYVLGESTPLAWFIAFDRAEHAEVSSLKAMALGVNAHVNNDIAQVLLELETSDKNHSDFKRVNSIIHNSIYEVLSELNSDKKWLSSRSLFLKPLYKILLSIIIRVWRAHAWQTFKHAKNSSNGKGILTLKLSRQSYIIGRGTELLPI